MKPKEGKFDWVREVADSTRELGDKTRSELRSGYVVVETSSTVGRALISSTVEVLVRMSCSGSTVGTVSLSSAQGKLVLGADRHREDIFQSLRKCAFAI